MKKLVITFDLGDDELTDEFVESLNDEADRDEAVHDLIGKGEYPFTAVAVEADPLGAHKVMVIRLPVKDAGRAERLQALLNLGPMSSHDVVGLVRNLLYEANPLVTIEG